MRESRAVVERWNWNGIEWTVPPQPMTSFAADDFLDRPVATLDQNLGPAGQDQFERRIRLEPGHDADAFQRGDNGEPVFEGIDGRSGPLPSRLTEASEFSATIRLEPKARDSAR